MPNYYVASFHSISQALRFEKLLQAQDIEVKMIPVPRVISSSCGIAARFREADAEFVMPLLTADSDGAHEVYRFSYEGKKVHAERVWNSAS